LPKKYALILRPNAQNGLVRANARNTLTICDQDVRNHANFAKCYQDMR